VELNPEFYHGYFHVADGRPESRKEEIYRPYLTRLIDDVLPRYLAKYPHDARARNCYGTELTQAGRCREGLREAERALSQAPNDSVILYASTCYFARFGHRTGQSTGSGGRGQDSLTKANEPACYCSDRSTGIRTLLRIAPACHSLAAAWPLAIEIS